MSTKLKFLLVFVLLSIVSLACSFSGGSKTPAPTNPPSRSTSTSTKVANNPTLPIPTLPPSTGKTPTAPGVSGKATIQDDFSNPSANDWPTGLDDDEYLTIRRDILNGKYIFQARAKQSVSSRAYPNKTQIADFTASVDYVQTTGVDTAYAGMVFRSLDANNQYITYFDKKGVPSLYALSNGKWNPLYEGTAPAPSYKPGAINKITVIAKGSNITVQMNGQATIQVSDSSFSTGRVGVVIELEKAGDEGSFEFDNFVVQQQ